MKRSKFHFTLGLAFACAALTFSLAVCAQAQTVTYIANFDGTNGRNPYGPMVQATDGNFYGAAFSATYPNGEIFRVTPAGKISTVYSFCSLAKCADGAFTTSPTLGGDGNLYGVSYYSSQGVGGYGYVGTVYRMTLQGEFTSLYTFCANSTKCTLSDMPSGIIQASDGNLYGTTYSGGTYDAGTFFQVSSTGTYKLLYSFCGCGSAQGVAPLVSPMQGSDGNFYGTAEGMRTGEGGVLYRLTFSGDYTVVHAFCYPCYGGGNPADMAPVEDATGNLFGSTMYAAGSNSGTLFEITPTGQYIPLHSFVFRGGNSPHTGLTLASDGNFYGVGINDDFDSGGSYGTTFEVTPAGEFTSLSHFYDNPNGPLVQGTDGNLYGTTLGSPLGSGGFGTIFKLSNGLRPLVKTAPVGGKVGKQVIILGNHLTGSTSVTFNGIPAEFTVESDTYIRATVPPGATTGTISVAAPSDMLNSNPKFVVTK